MTMLGLEKDRTDKKLLALRFAGNGLFRNKNEEGSSVYKQEENERYMLEQVLCEQDLPFCIGFIRLETANTVSQ
ncbi:uncharacterized protein isoform X2 [Rhodnius prolixus]|uniref:uncharacterized protein isoform X2 n=1 Tax=Rhodnius prolixus TaxID=13249 RepID=UPI003D18C1F5